MSARGFGSVIMAGAVAGAALGFYLVSLRVASERAALEEVETKIAMAQRDIRLLQTEIGTRGRLAQLERWNVKFIRLSAPTADQFVDGGFQLATLVKPAPTPVLEAPVVLASAPVEQRPTDRFADDSGQPAQVTSRPASQMVHVASYGLPTKDTAVMPRPSLPKPTLVRPATVKPVAPRHSGKAVAATKPVKSAMADPLAPLPGAKVKAKGSAPVASVGGISSKRQAKDSDSD